MLGGEEEVKEPSSILAVLVVDTYPPFPLSLAAVAVSQVPEDANSVRAPGASNRPTQQTTGRRRSGTCPILHYHHR